MTELDEALERFQRVGPEYAGGLANHGPMAAEALERLGHPALIPAWVERYAPRLPPAATGRVLRPEERPEQLGRFDAWPDWVATFEAELAERPWPEVAWRQ